MNRQAYLLGYTVTHSPQHAYLAGYMCKQAAIWDDINKIRDDTRRLNERNQGYLEDMKSVQKTHTDKAKRGYQIGTAGTGALAGAAAGGLGSLAWGDYQGEDPNIRRALLVSLLTGGVGAAGGALYGKHRLKTDPATQASVGAKGLLRAGPELGAIINKMQEPLH